MKFSEAMEKLKSGSKVTRHPWRDGVYFMMVNGEVKSFQPKLSPYIYNEDIMISDGWLIEGEDKEYKFSEIIPLLLQHKKARLKDWKETFIFFDSQTKSLVVHSMDTFPFLPDFESFIAQDWIELS